MNLFKAVRAAFIAALLSATLVRAGDEPLPDLGIEVNQKAVEEFGHFVEHLKPRGKEWGLAFEPPAVPGGTVYGSRAEFGMLRHAATGLDNIASPWEMFAFELRRQITGGENWKGVQLVTMPMAADWNHPRTGKFTEHRVLGDTLPAFGGSYRPTQRQITDGYRIFLENLALPLPDKAQQAKAMAAQREYAAALQDLEATWLDVQVRWRRFDEVQKGLPPASRVPFTTWYARVGQPRIDMAQDRVNLAEQTYTSYLREAYKGYPWAIDLAKQFNDPANKVEVEDPDGSKRPVHKFNITPSLQEFIDRSKALPAGSERLTIDVNKSSKRLNISQSKIAGGVSVNLGIFSFGGSAGKERYSVNAAASEFRMRFSAKNVSVFTVTPGRWFSGTAVQAFRKGPWVAGGPVATGVTEMWGERGVLGLMPVQIVVAYQPKVVARLSKSEYESVREQTRAGGGFSIGPFGFGASYQKTNVDIKFDDTSNTVTAEDKSESPQIIAVVSSVLPDFE